MTDNKLKPTQADREGPAPLPTPATLHCLGCRHLKTNWWKDHLDNDETDSGTSARCGAIPDEHGGKSISAYWSERDVAPKWCPHLEADSAATDTQVSSLNAEIERQEALVKTYRGAQLRAEEKLRREQDNAKGWKLRAERLEAPDTQVSSLVSAATDFKKALEAWAAVFPSSKAKEHIAEAVVAMKAMFAVLDGIEGNIT